MKYSMRTKEISRGSDMFVMHAAGCKDIRRDAATCGGYSDVFESSAATPEAAATEWLVKNQYDGPDCLYDSPWTVEHVDIKPCCRRKS